MKIKKPEDIEKECEELRRKGATLAISNILIIQRWKAIIKAGDQKRAKAIQKLQEDVEKELRDIILKLRAMEEALDNINDKGAGN